MKNLFKTALITLGLIAMAQGAVAAGDAAAGEANSTACAACHGSDGNSLAANFPKLAGLGEKYLAKQMQDIKAGTRPIAEMTGQLDNLSDQDIDDLAAFYASKPIQLSGAKEMMVQMNTGVEVDAIALGMKIFRAGNMETKVPSCTGCHSPTGQGNSPAGYPLLGGQHAAYIEKQLKDFRAGNRTNDGDTKIMRDVAAHMSDAEITAVANYISGLH
jgi:cytochrome c553